jgi:AbrB family looped-hinge helix DNA binding protein
METTMPYVRVKQKYQVTIPVTMRNKLNLHEGDTLEIKESNGNLVLVPQIVTTRIKNIPTENKSPLLSMIGANSGSGLYKSAKDIDDYISNLRNEWN